MEKSARLLFDEMLKKTCTWCRVFGIDSSYAKDVKDDELLGMAEGEGLALVSRDEELCDRARKKGIVCVFIQNDMLEEQIAQIVRELGLQLNFPDGSRCPACNHELRTVGKDSVKDRVPGNAWELNEAFWLCDGCMKAYWRGGHWENITRIFENVRALLEQTNKKPTATKREC